MSGGEAQRIKLAAELKRAESGARSVIVLDEPSTGLHATDLVPLARVLRGLVDRGDAVIMIEHHTGLLAACDRLVEIGPAGGAAGGELLAEGTPEELAQDSNSVTGPWLQESLRAAGVDAHLVRGEQRRTGRAPAKSLGPSKPTRKKTRSKKSSLKTPGPKPPTAQSAASPKTATSKRAAAGRKTRPASPDRA